MWNLIITIIFSIPAIYSFFKIGRIIDKDEYIYTIFEKKGVDISKYSNSSPKTRMLFIRYLIIFMLCGTIAFYFLIDYLNN